MVPLDTNWIVLENNTIGEICDDYNYSSDVEKLILPSNSIKTICPSFLIGLANSSALTHFDLSNNLLGDFPKDIQKVMKKIKLGNNPTDCNCDILPWMPDWLENTTLPSGEHVVTDYKNVMCRNLIHGKEKRVYRLKEEDLGCNPFNTPVWFVALLTLCGVLFISIGASLFAVFRRWNEVKFWLYLHFDILDKRDNNENLDGKIHDALLSYR